MGRSSSRARRRSKVGSSGSGLWVDGNLGPREKQMGPLESGTRQLNGSSLVLAVGCGDILGMRAMHKGLLGRRLRLGRIG